ncbi:MAG: hypothetical protein LBM75_11330 [Myxococcales bacterium]|jgi:hypothetical protein|nr:hypothetical protein [Myxococcales bacterium]
MDLFILIEKLPVLPGFHYSSGAGTLNLSTGIFTRTRPAINQAVIYGADIGISSALSLALRAPAKFRKSALNTSSSH